MHHKAYEPITAVECGYATSHQAAVPKEHLAAEYGTREPGATSTHLQ